MPTHIPFALCDGRHAPCFIGKSTFGVFVHFIFLAEWRGIRFSFGVDAPQSARGTSLFLRENEVWEHSFWL